MSALREAAQQALEALEKYRQMMFAEAGCRWDGGDAAITALRAALAQEQVDPTDPGFWGRVAARQASRIKQLEAVTQQALKALKSCSGVPHWPALQPTIDALRAVLAQEQATMTADDLADSIKRGEKWKVIGCIGHDCEECQTRIAKDALGNFQHQRKDA